MTAMRLLCVFCGGGLGACLRWLVCLGFGTAFPSFNPGVFAANIVGSFLAGLAAGWFGWHPGLPHEWRLFLVTGFLGGFTTFSAFTVETVELANKRPLYGLVYLAGHIVLCLVAAMAGFKLTGRA